MRILIALTYYRPHYSGLTIYAEREARALAQRGHQVTILTSRFNDDLRPHEFCDGVEVIRPKVWLHVSKGVIMPGILLWAWRLMGRVDVVHLHTPQLDAAPIAILARLFGKPVVLTYHCDLVLPKGWIHKAANRVSDLANSITASAANLIVVNTLDYAQNSPFLRRFLQKVIPLFPPVEVAPIAETDLLDFKRKFDIRPGERLIGMAARLATEKGVEHLVESLPAVLEKFPQARVLFVGPYQNVVGEEPYAARIMPSIQDLGRHWSFLGVVSPTEMSAFFHACEVVALPSLNSTESFGIVQVEAMACGTPVVASDLPGVRVPVQKTGSGLITAPANPAELGQALIKILDNPALYRGKPQTLVELSRPESVAAQYEHLFEIAPDREKIKYEVQARADSRSMTGNQTEIPKDHLWLHLRELPYFRSLMRAVEASYYAKISLPEPVLDVGCGDGHFATVAFDKPLAMGIDPALVSLREASRRGGYHGLCQSEGARMPFADGTFASAISNSVLEHIPDVEAVLAETRRVLRPGAPFAFCGPNQRFLETLSIGKALDAGFGGLRFHSLAESYRSFFNRISRHYHSDSPDVWGERLARAGFSLERWWYYYPPDSLHVTEWGHYFGLPSLVWRVFTGKWILAPERWNLWLTERFTRKHYHPDACEDGVCTFYIAYRN